MRPPRLISSLLALSLTIAGFAAHGGEPREVRIENLGHKIYVKDYPGSEPAMVMVHGFPDNHHIYDDLAPLLSQRGTI